MPGLLVTWQKGQTADIGFQNVKLYIQSLVPGGKHACFLALLHESIFSILFVLFNECLIQFLALTPEKYIRQVLSATPCQGES